MLKDILPTGATITAVPVKKTSSAFTKSSNVTSSSLTFKSNSFFPILITESLVIPGKIEPSIEGVFNILSFKTKIFADLASSIIF